MGVGFLAHETCESSGKVFELGGHWISQLGYRRSRGARFPAGFSLEDVAGRFSEIIDFANGAEYPDDAGSGEPFDAASSTAGSPLSTEVLVTRWRGDCVCTVCGVQ